MGDRNRIKSIVWHTDDTQFIICTEFECGANVYGGSSAANHRKQKFFK